MKIKKFGAIDIGSNAMRLLVTNVIIDQDDVQFNKSHLIRVPIRLGQDVFTTGKISERNHQRMIKAMQAFRLMMEVHEVEKYAACATSAMREAKNGHQIAKDIQKKANINIQIIDGKKEAMVIANSDLRHFLQQNGTYLYVDVGGGSTEFSVFVDGKVQASKSFKIGSVRLLNDGVSTELWQELEDWIKQKTKKYPAIQVIGSGGNINKILKLSGKSNKKPLSYPYIRSQYKVLSNMTYEERISAFQLNTDRADVIVPALSIYVNAMRWSKAKHIYIPKIGLSDGIVKEIYYKNDILDSHEISPNL